VIPTRVRAQVADDPLLTCSLLSQIHLDLAFSFTAFSKHIRPESHQEDVPDLRSNSGTIAIILGPIPEPNSGSNLGTIAAILGPILDSNSGSNLGTTASILGPIPEPNSGSNPGIIAIILGSILEPNSGSNLGLTAPTLKLIPKPNSRSNLETIALILRLILEPTLEFNLGTTVATLRLILKPQDYHSFPPLRCVGRTALYLARAPTPPLPSAEPHSSLAQTTLHPVAPLSSPGCAGPLNIVLRR
jgi:hypothetical protein